MSEMLLRDEAIDAVASANADWTPWAMLALHDAAITNAALTSDDVWKILQRKRIPAPTEPRAMGPVMLAGVKRGWVYATDRVRSSDDPASPNHARPQRVYGSNIYGNAPAHWPAVPSEDGFRCPRCKSGSLKPLEPTLSPRVRMGVCGSHGKTMFVKGGTS